MTDLPSSFILDRSVSVSALGRVEVELLSRKVDQRIIMAVMVPAGMKLRHEQVVKLLIRQEKIDAEK